MTVSELIRNPPMATPGQSRANCSDFVAADGQRYQIEFVTDLVDLDQYRTPWQLLADGAADPNVFYEPWFFAAAARYLPPKNEWRILLVWRADKNAAHERHLCGLFPFVQTRGFGGIRQWSLWNHPYCFLTNPLIERGQHVNVLRAVLHYARTAGHKISTLEFPLLAGEGPLNHGLTEVLRENLSATFRPDKYLRATTSYRGDVEEQLKNTIGGHHLREFRRQRRKLESQGQLEYRTLQDQNAVDLWIDWFLALEAAGWKAQAGTAMKLNEPHAEFFREMVRTGLQQSRVRMEGLFLNGEPVALKCNLLSPPAAFAFKIAFDESLRKCSPGIQLEFESLQQFNLQTRIDWADSCAAPDHPMINRIWSERRVIQHLIVSTGSIRGDLVISSLPLVRSLCRLQRRLTQSCMQFFKRPAPAASKPTASAGATTEPGRSV
ncbi:GNAT family N-acetyltransferase [Planctomicrobium piriforme]|uniref:Acetyltransferase involved in cellulose biosynthesis, CelD/BcsL family n=1 Tax=Planctomicrobium piriforme TaxID=1576369 RepID=A0A1I3SRW3_9PLAN|nr:GNAT family N-acetyltransferase [Planctomicrobium piriforme]SFJ60962.1 Acetyltransferase involved in cellulose biosynthesis, CelD/BcsL family [Planctomicrobium piriforme]